MTLDQRIRLLLNQIKRFSKIFYSELLNIYVDKFKVQDNIIVFNNANINLVSSIENRLSGKVDDELKRVKRFIMKAVAEYVRQQSNVYTEIDVRAIEASNKVIKGLEKHLALKVQQVTDLSPIYGEIKAKAINLMSRQNGVSLQEMRQMLEYEIVNKDIINSKWSRWTYDIYQQYERVAANEIRKKLGFSWAIYEGGEIDNSRCFCKKRNGRIFSESEIKSWAEEDWKGKNEIGYDPIVDLGGYNCRHRLRWVSDEFAERMSDLKGLSDIPCN